MGMEQIVINININVILLGLRISLQMKEISTRDKCTLAACSGVAMSFSNPFDLVRFRMQATPQLIKQSKLSSPYRSISQCAKTIYRQEGIKSFWKGNTSNLLRYYPSQSMNFFFKNFYQSIMKNVFSFKNGQDTMLVNSIGGTLGGVTTRLLLYPFDYTRTKMANDIQKKDGGIVKTLLTTIKKQGFLGIYRGAIVSFCGISIFRGTYFGIYDSYKSGRYHELQKWFLSYFSYVTATFMTYPTDTVRRRLMMTSCANYKYNGFFDCLTKIIKQQGVRSLFRGGNIIFLQACSGSTIYYIFDKIFANMSVMH